MGTTTCSVSECAASAASGRIETRRARGVYASRPAPAFERSQREHAPPTNPSMRPSANTIARSPRCADTGGAPCDDRGDGKRLSLTPQRWPRARRFGVVSFGHATASPATRAARTFSGSEPAGQLPLELDCHQTGRCTSRPDGFSNTLSRRPNVSSSRQAASRRGARVPHRNRSSGSSPATKPREQAPIAVERDDVRVAHRLARRLRQPIPQRSRKAAPDRGPRSSRCPRALPRWNRTSCGLLWAMPATALTRLLAGRPAGNVMRPTATSARGSSAFWTSAHASNVLSLVPALKSRTTPRSASSRSTAAGRRPAGTAARAASAAPRPPSRRQALTPRSRTSVR